MSVNAPLMVWVLAAVKVRVSAAATCLVKLLKVVVPEMACEVPSSITAAALGLKVVASLELLVQFPAIFRLKFVTEVSNVPSAIVRLPLTTVFAGSVNTASPSPEALESNSIL